MADDPEGAGDEGDSDLQLPAADAEYYALRRHTIMPCDLEALTEDDFPDASMNFAKSDTDVASIAGQIRTLFPFEGYNDEELMEFIDYMYARKVVRGEVLIPQGGKGDSFYLIRTGKYACTSYHSEEQSSLLCSYDGAGYFGDQSLFFINAPFNATFAATSDGELWVLSALRYAWLRRRQAMCRVELFDGLLRQVPGLSSRLTSSMFCRLLDAVEELGPLGEGEVICRQGEPADAVYFILKGEISACVDGDALPNLGVNQRFGERALILDEPWPATYAAVATARLARVPKVSFLLLIPDSTVDAMRDDLRRTSA